MFDFILNLAAYAQEKAAGPQQASFVEMMILPLGFVAIMYFLMIRPQQKKMKAHQALLEQLKVGDEVVTNAGMIGRIKSIADSFITLEIATNTNVKFLKNQIADLTKKPAEAPKK
jgi:preprotein translocase subunit YajC